MELFTGTQCGPCVAADVAFEALGRTYKPTELALIQYHMHIPGPDPMTNPADMARWKYYSKLFPSDIRGTPTVIFNGKPKPGGGGLMDGAGNYLASGAGFYGGSRWGDYEATAPDNTIATCPLLWIAGEETEASGNWGTSIGATDFCNPFVQ